ncbi:MAG TPA: hypothetical protein VE685_22315 [Thermoanaerobaculia bacterium]|nr:hypothetical protein [Thermoanaerobaculia bacterium]
MTTRESKPAEHFAETGTGAVTLLALQFLSLPLLLAGLAWMGLKKLFRTKRSGSAG